MNQGFQHSTRFIVKENGKETIKSFADYHDGDEITIKDKDNNWVTATVHKYDKKKVMYRVVLSNKKFISSDGSYFDFKGHHFTSEGIRYGILKNAEDDMDINRREYVGVGYAKIEKYTEVTDETVTTTFKQVGKPVFAYSLYDYNDTLIQNGLTLRELEELVNSLSHISYEELNQKILSKELRETGVTHHVNVTPVHKWILFNGYPTMFLKEGDRLYDHSKYNESDPTVSGYEWYVSDITIHRAMEEFPWSIETDSFQLEYGIVTGE